MSTPNSDFRMRAGMGLFFSHDIAEKSQFSSNGSSVAKLVNWEGASFIRSLSKITFFFFNGSLLLLLLKDTWKWE